jgi:hypothetical protein
MSKTELTVQDILDIYEEAEEKNIPPVICCECKKAFYTFFAQHNARYDRFMNGEPLRCIDHTGTDIIVDNLARPQN